MTLPAITFTPANMPTRKTAPRPAKRRKYRKDHAGNRWTRLSKIATDAELHDAIISGMTQNKPRRAAEIKCEDGNACPCDAHTYPAKCNGTHYIYPTPVPIGYAATVTIGRSTHVGLSHEAAHIIAAQS